ncbi:hypothetical protein Aperf_G00000066077 [Anoplocephala perfoliata]
MHESASDPTVATSPCERDEKEYRHGRRNKTDDKKVNAKKGLLRGFVAIRRAAIPGNSGPCNYDGECFQRKEFLPSICYKCRNNPYIKNTRKLVPDIVLNPNKSGGCGVILGGASDDEDRLQELCQEFVNRTALTKSKVLSADVWSNGSFNGRLKMVTKSYRLISNEGRVHLSATIIS